MHIRTVALRLTAFLLACAVVPAWAATWPKLDPALQAGNLARGGTLEAMIEMDHRADSLLLDRSADVVTRRGAWMKTLQSTADRTQADMIGYLKSRKAEYRSFWINNTLWVRASPQVLQSISQRADVKYVHANPTVEVQLPRATDDAGVARAAEWGVAKIGAPQVWAAGARGTGVVVAGIDTGVRWDHAALKSQYRGWNGAAASHAYNWHDAVRSGYNTTCAANRPAPCDDHDHGSHTIGTMVGEAGANQIGVAPGAKWIACRGFNNGSTSAAMLTECLQWMLAPTDLAGANPDPSKAPDVINNSWFCGSCGATANSAVEALVDAGIFVVASAGNSGAKCSTIPGMPATLEKAFSIGSTTSADAMSSFSSRGPVSGATFNKPDVVAPGSNIRSSTKNGSYASMNGTSMAGPHVAGAAALLISAYPALRGHPDQIADLLRSSAVHLADTQVCGGVPATKFPNPVQGDGRIDVYAAYQAAQLLYAEDEAG